MIVILINEIIGWTGAAAILLAFWLLTHKVVHSHSYVYLGLNLLGGVALAYEAWTHLSHASFVLNLIWIAIAIYGLGWAHKRKAPKLKR